MKLYLFMKHSIKENYKYLLTMLLSYGFLAILYHITESEPIRYYGIQMVAYLLTLAHALILPSVLFRNYYHATNVNHQASIPLKRFEIFFSLYFVGLGLSVGMILGYSCLTTLLLETTTSFVGYSSTLLIAFMYYYHLSLLAFWICGHGLFQSVVMIMMIFGPFITFMVYQWALEMYDQTYLLTSSIETIFHLLPGIGCGAYWIEGVDAAKFYSLYLNETFAFLLLTLVAVKKRRYERTGQSMVFHSLSYVVRSGMTILGTASLFAIFGSILGTHDYVAQIITACILGVMVAYIVEMMYKHKLKVFHSVIYGLLAAFFVFGTVHLGTKALEGYIPSNVTYATVSQSDYDRVSYVDDVKVTDDASLQLLLSLNKEMMSYYENNMDDIDYNASVGYINFYYYRNQSEPFFARRYPYTKKMRTEVLDQTEYRDILFTILTDHEQNLIEQASKKQILVFSIEDKEYILDTDAKFYLFENYLKKELETIYNSDQSLFEAFNCEVNISWEGNDEYGYHNSQPLYNALSKTFGF